MVNSICIFINLIVACFCLSIQAYPGALFCSLMFFLCLGDKLKDEIIEAIKENK